MGVLLRSSVEQARSSQGEPAYLFSSDSGVPPRSPAAPQAAGFTGRPNLARLSCLCRTHFPGIHTAGCPCFLRLTCRQILAAPGKVGTMWGIPFETRPLAGCACQDGDVVIWPQNCLTTSKCSHTLSLKLVILKGLMLLLA